MCRQEASSWQTNNAVFRTRHRKQGTLAFGAGTPRTLRVPCASGATFRCSQPKCRAATVRCPERVASHRWRAAVCSASRCWRWQLLPHCARPHRARRPPWCRRRSAPHGREPLLRHRPHLRHPRPHPRHHRHHPHHRRHRLIRRRRRLHRRHRLHLHRRRRHHLLLHHRHRRLRLPHHHRRRLRLRCRRPRPRLRLRPRRRSRRDRRLRRLHHHHPRALRAPR